MMRRLATLAPCVALLLTGCATFGPKAANGIVFYSPGAGNVDFTDGGIRAGLEQAGFKGEVATFVWTALFNPLLDQRLTLNARLRARQLAGMVEDYIDRYPDRPVYMIGLSAGTGVTLWALENLGEKYKVDNVILLGSSLWHRYDAREALRHVKGKIYNYYSSNDVVLAGPMKIFGSIDGVFGDDGAGAVGLHSPGAGNRIVNIGWRPEFSRYGYNGGHTDCAAPEFVRRYVARHVVTSAESETPETVVANRRARPPRDERPGESPGPPADPRAP